MFFSFFFNFFFDFFFLFNNFIVKFNFNFLLNLDFSFYLFLILSFTLYVCSLIGLILNIKNLLISLLFVELTYFGIIFFILISSSFFSLYLGFLYSLLLILVAASESAVGLGILIVVYNFEKRITFDHLIELEA